VDEYLKEHFVIKFLLFLLLGIGLFIFSYILAKGYKKEGLDPITKNSLKRMEYLRSIGGMFLGIAIILMSFYMLYDDLTKPKEDNSNRVERVEIRK
jgi:hypothetical protein